MSIDTTLCDDEGSGLLGEDLDYDAWLAGVHAVVLPHLAALDAARAPLRPKPQRKALPGVEAAKRAKERHARAIKAAQHTKRTRVPA